MGSIEKTEEDKEDEDKEEADEDEGFDACGADGAGDGTDADDRLVVDEDGVHGEDGGSRGAGRDHGEDDVEVCAGCGGFTNGGLKY